MRYTFKKEEKLKSGKLIDSLFESGERIKSFPLQLVYLETPHTGSFPVQVAFSVPKRNFKRAVDRNKLKRLLREAYRLHKYDLNIFQETEHTKKYIFMFIYIGKETLSYDEITQAMLHIFSQFNLKTAL